MPSKTYTTQEIVAYLLDQMPESEVGNFERSYFEDQVLASTVTEVEDNLVDDYVRGQLKWREKKYFEKYYLTIPSRRRRVETAKLFISKVGDIKRQDLATESPASPLPRNKWLRVLALSPAALGVLAGLLILGAGFYLWQFNYGRHNADLSPTLSASSSPSPSLQFQPSPTPLQAKQVKEEVARVRPPQLPTSLKSPKPLTLRFDASDTRRGPGRAKPSLAPNVITAETKEIQIRLKTIVTNYQAYTAKVFTGDDKEIFVSADKIIPVRRGRLEIITLTIPASSFKTGSFYYTLALSGILNSEPELVRSITFQIDKR